MLQSRLPDGMCSNQLSQFGYVLEGFGMENVATFYGHLEYITAIWYYLGSFGNLIVRWYIFLRFGILYQ
jgi:hypothetical protein